MFKRRRGEEGANAVEFALVLPILIILLLGMFFSAIALDRKLAIAAGVREGARHGAILQVGVPDPIGSFAGGTWTCPDAALPPLEAAWCLWLEQIFARTINTSDAQLAASAALVDRYVCVAYVEGTGGTLKSVRGEQTGGNATIVVTQGSGVTAPVCYDDGLADKRVQVSGQRDADFEAVFVRPSITLRDDASAQYEFSDSPIP